jgi:hypothetical protein
MGYWDYSSLVFRKWVRIIGVIGIRRKCGLYSNIWRVGCINSGLGGEEKERKGWVNRENHSAEVSLYYGCRFEQFAQA